MKPSSGNFLFCSILLLGLLVTASSFSFFASVTTELEFVSIITIRVMRIVNMVVDWVGFSNTSTGLDVGLPKIESQDDLQQFFKDQLRLILPGTKWCGDGDIARNNQSLGVLKIDECCKAHDQCDESIPSGAAKHGLVNPGLFTRSHCTCDDAFFRCLRDNNDLVSSKVAYTYFNILGPQCFKKEQKISDCTKMFGRCVEYTFDNTSSPKYQWFDNKYYTYLPLLNTTGLFA